jgi:hypothetical protein
MRVRILLVSIAVALNACGKNDQTNNGDNSLNATTANGVPNGEPGNADPGNGDPGNNVDNSTLNGATNGATSNGGNSSTNSAPNGTTSGDLLAAEYPGDSGIDSDPDVVWYEDFEQGSVDALVARYDDAKSDGLSFSDDIPSASSGAQSVVMAASGGASDLFKLFPEGYQQLFVRYYVRYEDAPYHHSGVWMGGYNPATSYPNPQAGERPNGNDRVSIAIEPNGDHPMGRRMDFYNYWRGMHTWRAPGEPTGSGSWYGNSAIHRDEFYMRDGEWMCIEFMVRLNDDPDSMAGGELAVWSEDELLYHYTDDGPLGYWVRDKFCPADADSADCTDYAPAEREQEVLDVQWRSSADLTLNWVWPQNYISEGSGELRYDDFVVATRRIGCIQ